MSTDTQHLAYVGIGSNLNDPHAQVMQACQQLAQHPDIQLAKCSAWYQSAPVGPGEQDDYVNGAVLLHTTLSAHALLHALQTMENAQHRQRIQRWGARTLDLDILLFDSETIDTPDLVIPHPRIDQRNFVLQPLLDLNEHLHLPDGRLVADILNIIGFAGLKRLATDSSSSTCNNNDHAVHAPGD